MEDNKITKVYKYLFQMIKDSKFSDKLLPSENSLINKFGYSRNTIRNAYNKLIADNLVVAIKGRGYVPQRKAFNKLLSYKEQYGPDSSSIILKINEKTNFNESIETSHWYEIHKVRYINEKPHIYTIQEVPSNIFDNLKDAKNFSSLYRAFEQANIKVFYANKTIELINTPENLKKYFQVQQEKIVYLVSYSYDFNENILERSHNYYLEEFKWKFTEYSKK